MRSSLPAHPPPPGSTVYRLAAPVLLCAAVVLVLFIYRDYGITWDEPNFHVYGLKLIEYYAGAFDHSVLPIPEDGNFTPNDNILLYGGLFETLVATCVEVFGGDGYETRHLVNALVGLVGVIGAWKVARLLAGYRAALLASVLLVLEPNYFGMMFNNPKDIPFAAGYVWTIYYLLRTFEHLPTIPNALLVKLGLAIGCMAGVRVPGLIGFAYFCLIAVTYALVPKWFTAGPSTASRPASVWRPLLVGGVGVFLTAYVLMILCWPWAHLDPVLNPYRAYRVFSSFTMWDGYILFDGALVHSFDLPLRYLPQYFLVKVPDLVLIGVGLALVLGVHALVTRRASIPNAVISRYGLLAFALLFPPLFAVANKAVLYDTIRHFLFLVPLLCVISGLAFDRAAEVIGAADRRLAPVFLGVLAFALLLQVATNVQLHPDQYVYYNSLAGGLRGAAGRYETDYWGNSYKEAAEMLVAHVRQAEPETFDSTTYRVHVCGPYFSAAYYLPRNFAVAETADDADFFIGFTRADCHRSVEGAPIAAVTRQGVALTVIKDLRRRAPSP